MTVFFVLGATYAKINELVEAWHEENNSEHTLDFIDKRKIALHAIFGIYEEELTYHDGEKAFGIKKLDTVAEGIEYKMKHNDFIIGEMWMQKENMKND